MIDDNYVSDHVTLFDVTKNLAKVLIISSLMVFVSMFVRIKFFS